jgi:hypothetical protein
MALRGSLVLLAVLSTGAFWAYALMERLERRPLPLSVLALATGLFAFGLYFPSFPSERFHFLEYGLLGALVLRASLKTRPAHWGASFGLAALVLTSIGVMDEVIQYFLPSRVFDWRDIWFNLSGGVLGFAAYLVVAPPKRCG